MKHHDPVRHVLITLTRLLQNLTKQGRLLDRLYNQEFELLRKTSLASFNASNDIFLRSIGSDAASTAIYRAISAEIQEQAQQLNQYRINVDVFNNTINLLAHYKRLFTRRILGGSNDVEFYLEAANRHYNNAIQCAKDAKTVAFQSTHFTVPFQG